MCAGRANCSLLYDVRNTLLTPDVGDLRANCFYLHKHGTEMYVNLHSSYHGSKLQ